MYCKTNPFFQWSLNKRKHLQLKVHSIHRAFYNIILSWPRLQIFQKYKGQCTYIWCEDLQPPRRLILPIVLQAERHALLVHLPLPDGVPLQHHHLALRGAVLPAGVQLDASRPQRQYDVAVLARVAGAVREDHLAIAGQLPGQLEVFHGPRVVLEGLQLVETFAGVDVASVHLVHCLKSVENVINRLKWTSEYEKRNAELPYLPEYVWSCLRVGHQRQFLVKGEQPFPNTQTSTGCRAVVLYVQVVGVLVRLQFPFCKVR